MPVQLNMVEQHYQAVLEVTRDGATFVEVARRSGVSRQTVHAWLKRYAVGGLSGWLTCRPSRIRVRTRASVLTRGRA